MLPLLPPEPKSVEVNQNGIYVASFPLKSAQALYDAAEKAAMLGGAILYIRHPTYRIYTVKPAEQEALRSPENRRDAAMAISQALIRLRNEQEFRRR